MNQGDLEEAIAAYEEQYLKPRNEEFDARKQANGIIALCFRNTRLEDFHADGYVSDSEMKNLSIESCARMEYLMLCGKFDDMTAADIFTFCFETPYRRHVERDLRKQMWRVLRRESERKLRLIQFARRNEPLTYKAMLLDAWSRVRYYNEDIKFDGTRLSGDPNGIAVGHQRSDYT